MFGIGLPEMILILALALIVVGPDKLPDLARSVAKGVMELKKTAEALKKNLTEDGNPLDSIHPEINSISQSLSTNLLESSDPSWKTLKPGEGVNPAPASPSINETEITTAEHEPENTALDRDADLTADHAATQTSSSPDPIASTQESAPSPPC